jgi:hypothetical protein
VRSCIDFLFRRPLLTYLLMGMFFMLFGTTSVDLFFILRANINLFLEYGSMVIADGALQQLAELLGLLVVSACCFVLCAVCERILIKRLLARWVASRAEWS